jgi:hypothetical protein
MLSREEAVMWLQARGLHAFLRDWVLGQTVGVAARATEGPHGITMLDRLIYLYSGADGAWVVADLSTNEDFPCEGLRQAAELAAKRLTCSSRSDI